MTIPKPAVTAGRIALTGVLLASGLWPFVAFGLGWHAARKVPLRRRGRAVFIL